VGVKTMWVSQKSSSQDSVHTALGVCGYKFAAGTHHYSRLYFSSALTSPQDPVIDINVCFVCFPPWAVCF